MCDCIPGLFPQNLRHKLGLDATYNDLKKEWEQLRQALWSRGSTGRGIHKTMILFGRERVVTRLSSS
eukprot:1845557-Amphidinium_carterae.1